MKKDLLFLAGAFLFLLILFAVVRRGGGGGNSAFRGVSLSSASSGPVSLDACPTAKCLTVYVAPWCKICRASTGLIKALAQYLKQRGVDTRIVVGDGSPEEIKAYAGEIGPGTLMDLEGKVPVAGGVPNFMVSDNKGKLLGSIPGVPSMAPPPYTDEVLKEFAEYLSLP